MNQIPNSAGGEKRPSAPLVQGVYEHTAIVRVCHWLTAISLPVLTFSGVEILRAFPSFGSKVPQVNAINLPPSVGLGGWLGGALQWHFTFMWLFAAAGLFYVGHQLSSGRWRQVLCTIADVGGVWPMIRHYFFFGPKPRQTPTYNPLQKLAYSTTIILSAVSLLSGLALYKPVQLHWLVVLFGGFRLARVWHFAAMCGFLAFVPGYLIMVALHGWNNLNSMLTGWKRDPEYAPISRESSKECSLSRNDAV